MTKKFFNDWSNKRSLTQSIKLNIPYSFEKNNKLYFVHSSLLYLNTLEFEGEYISIVANIHWYYTDKNSHGEEMRRIKIHRKDINTVHFK